MQYKRFTTTKENAAVFIPPEPPPIVQTVSSVEIGSDELAAFAAPVRRAKRYGAIFRVFMLTAALGAILLPFTQRGKYVLDLASGLLTADDSVVRSRTAELLGILSAKKENPPNAVTADSSGFSPSILSFDDSALSESFYIAAPTNNSTQAETADSSAPSSDGESPREALNNVSEPSTSGNLSNETAYSVDLDALSSVPYPIPPISDKASEAVNVFGENTPSVLILHTHGTECYSDSQNGGSYRSDNPEENVVSVGKVLAEELSAQGIEVLHCEEMFDKDSFIKAYQNSYAAVKEYLSRYPSVRYVIDLHRDAVPSENGYVDLKTEIDGNNCAKLMLVVGTDEAGAVHPNWKENLRVAQAIFGNAEQQYPSLMRNTNLRRASFNQQLSSGYFILEVGSCGGTLAEAKQSMPYFAKAFADTIKGQ